MELVITKKKDGRKFILAARAESKTLWLNPNKTTAKRKTLKDLWTN